MDEQTILNPSVDVLFQSLGEDMVLVHLGTNSIFSLNPTAARVWEILKTGCNRTELLARMAEEFDVSKDELAKELNTFLSTLSREGLLQRSGGNP